MRPMLACKTMPFEKLRLPLYASPKLDGIRCIIADGVALSRSLKPIPNMHVQKLLGRPELNGLDGELIIGEPTAHDVYNRTHRGVMTYSGEPTFTYYVFDLWNSPETYLGRVTGLWNRAASLSQWAPVSMLEALPLADIGDLVEYEEHIVRMGYEGLILRNPHSMYKHGRSTPKEQGMVKVKRFCDSEAEVLGAVELMHNDNVVETNELGLTKRSTHKENLRPGGMLGALRVRDIHTGVQFEIGTGFTMAERKQLWEGGELKGMLAKYRYFPVGVKDRPRHPVFRGWRHPDDMDANIPRRG